ncbi:uncharacterized protein DUF2442 [Anaerobacterium chartisolvens]|uniref:Uncharacterized protein DUF2442 n=1 Tax=Anaerobacterium chartisolvens TaxID=1297424 RepID=A0A369AZS6_9FIRM|nr:DUF2442 domain-containing protein [Anaerobacterium chartisolvens]RCX13838.1 uncharacterized protein DUF2442 [Anaerobacterium chartisolvens]
MFHKIKSVTALPDYILLVHFSDGTAKQYDVKLLFKKFETFEQLKTPGLFSLVSVDTGGYGVSWNDDIDLSCNELWNNGKKTPTPFDNLIAFGDATDLWGLNESTLRKAVSYGKLIDGVDVKKFGKQWIVSKAAMIREYGQPQAEKAQEDHL